MTTSTLRRARNSLSKAHFISRLNKNLPLFIAYGELNHVECCFNCRDLHLHKLFNRSVEFVTMTKHYPSGSGVQHLSLLDMNVYRNVYNKNFAFRTKKAATKYLNSKGI